MHLFCTVVAALLCWWTSARCELTLADPAREVGGRLWDPRTYSPDDNKSNAQSDRSFSAARDSAQQHRRLQAGCGVYPNPVGLARTFLPVQCSKQQI
jgi:hypothetical protein